MSSVRIKEIEDLIQFQTDIGNIHSELKNLQDAFRVLKLDLVFPPDTKVLEELNNMKDVLAETRSEHSALLKVVAKMRDKYEKAMESPVSSKSKSPSPKKSKSPSPKKSLPKPLQKKLDQLDVLSDKIDIASSAKDTRATYKQVYAELLVYKDALLAAAIDMDYLRPDEFVAAIGRLVDKGALDDAQDKLDRIHLDEAEDVVGEDPNYVDYKPVVLKGRTRHALAKTESDGKKAEVAAALKRLRAQRRKRGLATGMSPGEKKPASKAEVKESLAKLKKQRRKRGLATRCEARNETSDGQCHRTAAEGKKRCWQHVAGVKERGGRRCSGAVTPNCKINKRTKSGCCCTKTTCYVPKRKK